VKTHFDTEHLLTVKWTADNMPPALDELKSAIRNDFPTMPCNWTPHEAEEARHLIGCWNPVRPADRPPEDGSEGLTGERNTERKAILLFGTRAVPCCVPGPNRNLPKRCRLVSSAIYVSRRPVAPDQIKSLIASIRHRLVPGIRKTRHKALVQNARMAGTSPATGFDLHHEMPGAIRSSCA
jgi:hypothetical protein